MNRRIIRVLIALATFTIGLASAELGIVHRRPVSRYVKVETAKAPQPKSEPQFIRFENTGLIDMFMTFYNSSDGATLSFGCFEEGYMFSMARELPRENKYLHIIEHTPKLNAKGVRIGERIVYVYAHGLHMSATINWTEGSRFYVIEAPTLWYAHAFERSNAWADEGCTDFKLMHRQFELVPPPTKTFNLPVSVE